MSKKENKPMLEWHEGLNDAEFAQLLETFTEWPSGLDDEIPTELAFTTRSRIEPVQSTLILQGQIIGGRLVLSAPPGACVPESVQDIEIRLSNVHIFVSLEPSMA